MKDLERQSDANIFEVDKLKFELKAARVGELGKFRINPPQFDRKASRNNYFLQFEAASSANG